MSTPYTFSGFTVSNSINGITTDNSHIYIINSPTESALKNVLLSAYAVEHFFLPLTGGITTGDVQFNKRIIAYSYATSHDGPFITFDKAGGNAAGIGPDGTPMTIQFGTVDNYSSTA